MLLNHRLRHGINGALWGAVLASGMVCFATLAAGKGATHRVVIEKFRFVPAKLTIRQGDTVEWINRDAPPHTATDKSGSWNTMQLNKGRSARITFSTPGKRSYLCLYHPVMRGEITVVGK